MTARDSPKQARLRCPPAWQPSFALRSKRRIGGRGGIRTHGGLPHARFRVECLKPDSATLPSLQDRHASDRSGKERVYYEATMTICKLALSLAIVAPARRS